MKALAAALGALASFGCGGAAQCPDPASAADRGQSAAAVTTEPTRPASGAAPIRVMSYNVRFDNPKDGEHAWPHRRDRVAELVRYHRPDLLGVQEAMPHQTAELAERLPDYRWFGQGRDGEEGGEMSAIFYRADRFEVLDEGTFWLSETPESPSRGWDAQLNRIATWGKLRDRESARELLFVNTHFDHRGLRAREMSAALMTERLEAMRGGLPAVVTGDFNATPDSEPYARMTSSLTDAMTISATGHYGPVGTAIESAAFTVRFEPLNRIDYIFVTDGVKVLRHANISQHWQGVYPSDHLAVMAEIVLPDR